MRTWVHPQLLPLRNLPFPPPQKRPAAQPSTARPQSRKSPKILQILLQTIRPFPRKKAKRIRRPAINRMPAIPKISQNPANPASDNLPFPRRKKDPPPNHQPFACNPENPPKFCKSCFRQSALSPAAKKTRRPTINRSPAILKIPQNPANPASDNLPFPPPPKGSADQTSTGCPQSRKSPKIL